MTITLPQLLEQPLPSRTALSLHPGDLISQLLKEQSTLSAVDQFSDWHQTQAEPAQAKHYRNLLPATMPRDGQQLAFEVDLDKCSGCKACVVACHSLNGLDEGESFRDVGLLLSISENSTAFQHVTTACHHCVDPGCLNACPVNAYEKDPVTGIVRHLDDQCFGCQYCTWACPYEVPKYHAAKGIVRKCDMCSQRLSAGEAPACVQACPHEAISIRTIDIGSARLAAVSADFLPDSPDPGITLPTTRYIGKATTNPGLSAGSYAVHNLEHAHWPLVVLLVFSQISVGLATLVWLLRPMELFSSVATTLLAIAATMATIAAVSSTLHLGRPQFAYRAILGFGHSWLSREIVAFGAFIPLCVASTCLSFVNSALLTVSLTATVVSGIAGIGASVMIYHITRRPFWNAMRSAPIFLATSLGVSSIVVQMAMQLSEVDASVLSMRLLAGVAILSGLVKLFVLRRSLTKGSDESQLRGARVRRVMRLQTLSGIGFVLLCGTLVMSPRNSISIAIAVLTMVLGLTMEFSERYLFFRAVVPLRMPGVVKA